MDRRIHETKDYDKFSMLLGNRGLNRNKIEAIKKSIKDQGCPLTLVKVNEKFEILDGQHQFTAKKELSLPINYFIAENETIKDARIQNTNQKNWSRWDYIKSYSDEGIEDYKKLYNLPKLYPEFPQKELFIMLALNKKIIRYTVKLGFKDPIKDGSLKLNKKAYENIINILEKIKDYKIITGTRYNNYFFVRAIIRVLDSQFYDHNKMIEKIKKYPNIPNREDSYGYIEELNKKYNYKNRKKVYFTDIENPKNKLKLSI